MTETPSRYRLSEWLGDGSTGVMPGEDLKPGVFLVEFSQGGNEAFRIRQVASSEGVVSNVTLSDIRKPPVRVELKALSQDYAEDPRVRNIAMARTITVAVMGALSKQPYISKVTPVVDQIQQATLPEPVPEPVSQKVEPKKEPSRPAQVVHVVEFKDREVTKTPWWFWLIGLLILGARK